LSSAILCLASSYISDTKFQITMVHAYSIFHVNSLKHLLLTHKLTTLRNTVSHISCQIWN